VSSTKDPKSDLYVGGSFTPADTGATSIDGPIITCCSNKDNCNDQDFRSNSLISLKVDAEKDGATAPRGSDGDVKPANSVTDTVKPIDKHGAAVSSVGELTLVKVLAFSLTGLMMKLH